MKLLMIMIQLAIGSLVIGLIVWPIWNYCFVPAFAGLRHVEWWQTSGMIFSVYLVIREGRAALRLGQSI